MAYPKRLQKSLTRIVLALLAIGFAATVITFAYFPVGKKPYQTVTIEIPKGTGFLQIVALLDDAGFVTNKPFFYALAVFKGAARQIRAGEYELSSNMSPIEIIDKLVQGRIKAYDVTIPEDFTVREIAVRLASYKLVDEKVFLALASDRPFLSSLGIDGKNAEGFLYPETYRLDRSMGARDIMKMMNQQFWKVVTPDLRRRASEMGMTLAQAVTLASIIGKETGYTEEKPLVSAVFHNRLRKGMKLQSDPTAVYDLENFNGPVRRTHLLRDHTHNTYRIHGLPPGPIGNPAIDSIKAALYPAKADYLYFVSTNDGAHTFSTNLIAHNRAVSKYQIQKKKQ
jgi:UPF0755 protein